MIRRHILVYALSVAAFVTIQTVIPLDADSIIFKQGDVVFGADADVRARLLAGQEPIRLSVSHALLGLVWGTLGGALADLAGVLGVDPDYVFASRALVALVGSAGLYAIIAIGLRLGLTTPRLAIAFAVSALATANVVSVLPDHPGLSYGILGLAWLVYVSNITERTRMLGLAFLTILAAGTTVTNALLPAGMLLAQRSFHARLVQLARSRPRVTILIICSALPLLALVAWYATEQILTGDTIVTQGLRHKWEAGWLDPFFFLGAPIIGPAPVSSATSLVSFNGLGLGDYYSLTLVGLLCWLSFLGMSAFLCFRFVETRRIAIIAMLWLLFNYVFHSFWGDQFFLFAPHWTGALLVLFVFALPHFGRWAMVATSGPLIVGQILTLMSLRDAIQSLG